MVLYDFWATPDDQDCLQKCYYATKYGAVSGAVFSIYEMAFRSKPLTVGACTARCIHFTVPFALTGFTFATTTFFLSKLRKKDDYLNHVGACFAASGVWALRYNCFRIPVTAAAFIASGAGYVKYMRDHKLEMYKSYPKVQWRYYSSLDKPIKLYEDPGRPKTWTCQD